MSKSWKKYIHENKLVILFIVAALSFVIGFITYLASSFVKEPQGNLTRENVVDQLALGPQIPYNDPLISPAKISYPVVKNDDPYQGNTFADVTIFEYANIDCSDCLAQQRILDAILDQYGNTEVRVVWKGTATTPEGVLAQQAIYCADLQDKFWDYQLRVYEQYPEITRQSLSTLAASLELDVTVFDNCIDSALMEEKIYLNNGEAIDLGVDTLPYFFIDNYRFRGPLNDTEFRLLIDHFIAAHK